MNISAILCLIRFAGLHQIQSLPNVELLTLDGIKVNASEISNNDKPMVVVFWKSNQKECCDQLNMMNDVYEDFFKQKGVKVIAICVDCKGSIQHIKPFVYGHSIDFEVYIDKNGDFKRSMNVSQVPYTILYDDKMDIYCQYVGYCNGSEDIICTKIENCLAASDYSGSK
ncbi:MAG: TlpA disulfide reductase family protein [Bacteroidales bacterium]